MQIGRYQVVREIASGGMGRVLEAFDPNLQRRVAIKLLLQGAGATPAQRERFRREALALARLRHPGLVQVYEAGSHDGCPFLVLDFVEGESLAARLESGPLPYEEAVRLCRELAQGMAAAHQEGILHRDLKPANVLLRDERALLTDFGLARDMDTDKTRISIDGRFMGSPGYCPPEQVQGKLDEMSPASDVYGLGATLFAMLTGEPPFEGQSLAEVAVATLSLQPTAPSELEPGIPASLDSVILRCLAKEPRRRYPSMEALDTDLGRVQNGEQVEAPKLKPFKAPRARDPNEPMPEELSPHQVWLVLAVLALGLIGLVIAMWTGQNWK